MQTGIFLSLSQVLIFRQGYVRAGVTIIFPAW